MKLLILVLISFAATTLTVSNDASIKPKGSKSAPVLIYPKVWFERDDLNHNCDNLKRYSEMMEENPRLCLQISHYRHPEEKEGIGKKRLKRFVRHLKKQSFDMDRIKVSYDHHIVHCDKYKPCHAEIYFEVVSLEGHCN